MNEEFLSAIFNTFNKTNSNMCAILYNKSQIYSVGYNTLISHAHIFRKKYMVPSIHAEVDAIRKFIYERVSPTRKRPKLKLIVLRKNNAGNFMNSKPCKNCISFMKSELVKNFINIREVTFYEDGGFKSCLLSSLESNHISSGWKAMYRHDLC